MQITSLVTGVIHNQESRLIVLTYISTHQHTQELCSTHLLSISYSSQVDTPQLTVTVGCDIAEKEEHLEAVGGVGFP